MGPNFLVTNDNKLKVADFNFNVWGYEDPSSEGSKMEEEVDRDIANAMKLDVISTRIISEGGNREFNGKGVMLVTKYVETQRNPGKTLEELETEYKRVLGVEKIIWLETMPL
jgi:agmatine deiminase